MRNKPLFPIVITLSILALCAGSATAVPLANLVRLKGLETNEITGLGLVVGLPGTGDTESALTLRPLAQYMRNLGDAVGDPTELLATDSIALVHVRLEIPAAGAREGDRLDVHVETMMNAKSLKGGRLAFAMLYAPRPVERRGPPLAFASGSLVIQGDNPRSAVIRDGGQMLDDQWNSVVAGDGTITLVMHDQYATYAQSDMIANEINEWFGVDGITNLAIPEDAKNVRVIIPEADLPNPVGFIAEVLRIRIDISLIETEARITINERAGIITAGDNVELSRAAITHKDLTITTIVPPRDPTADEPQVLQRRWTGLDTSDGTNRGSVRLQELINALNQLNVPVKDQIAIIEQLVTGGYLHARIIRE
ncbi:MAG: flagellar basal body P-ring protein FlgI [Phycisphaerales bacterium]|nr:flagellar basal body P-ring protein FlgI [Phycisphaerales bacterium]